jgi:site-specific DNA-methyltransferase (adenine-specific)
MKILTIVRKPLSESSISENIEEHGTGAINIEDCRIKTDDNLNGVAYAKNPTPRDDLWSNFRRGGAGDYVQPLGRWPSNMVLEDNPKLLDVFPYSKDGGEVLGGGVRDYDSPCYGDLKRITYFPKRGGEGSASRFFYKVKKWNHDGKKD